MRQIDPGRRRRPTASAKSVLLTVLGEFVLPSGGEVWTGTLVGALDVAGYSDRNARQAIARLRDDGVISPERHGRRTRWQLTAEGDELLRLGAERIYRFGARADSWDGSWLVVMCAVPETQREKRRQLHTQLSFAGFGFVSPTVAVSPHVGAEPTVSAILDQLDLTADAVVLTARTADVTSDADLLGRSWDLDALGDSYRTFIEEFTDLHPAGGQESFRCLVRLVHAWRHFPFADPELPPELLPPGWAGNIARHLFDDARRSWSTEAVAFYKALEAEHEPH